VVQEKVLMCGQAAVPRLQQHLPRKSGGFVSTTLIE